VWDSAIVLAKYVEKHPEMFRGLRVCELGAGCGLVSAALVAVGASRVVATDLGENLQLLRENLETNCGGGGSGSGASAGADAGGGTMTWDVRELIWGQDAATALGETFDLVVATDCMYIVEAVPDLVSTLVALVGYKPGEDQDEKEKVDTSHVKKRSTRSKSSPSSASASTSASTSAADPPVLFSYGRNRQGEVDFLRECDGAVSGRGVTLTLEDVPEDALDDLYQCSDVRVVSINMTPTTVADAGIGARTGAADATAAAETAAGGTGRRTRAQTGTGRRK